MPLQPSRLSSSLVKTPSPQCSLSLPRTSQSSSQQNRSSAEFQVSPCNPPVPMADDDATIANLQAQITTLLAEKAARDAEDEERSMANKNRLENPELAKQIEEGIKLGLIGKEEPHSPKKSFPSRASHASYIVQNNQAKPTLTFPEEDECFMMEEEEDVESDQSEVIDPDMGDEEEQAKEEILQKWKEHPWAKHNLEDPDIPFVENDEWLRIWFENRKKEKERVIMMGRHARFEPAQIVVPINGPKIPTPRIVWETINLIEKVEEFQMQPWVNPYDECDYSQWIEEREDLDFTYPDPYKTRESDFDEMEEEYDDLLNGISLASLFNQMEIINVLHNYTINKEDEEVKRV
ncbi:hypothetical protein RHMOL_Rhmol11G0027400 [Rhododendron molle]|uniref:Uncharacterized protein n=1 Tax=Rhododendron molle TaxID=49168 RepID=A0ACC0LN09_RHOML|nr:hypothetical protein RHMOL_Rhmol11G0027400 [Rhododendron molle]